jgi:hypothetical protein
MSIFDQNWFGGIGDFNKNIGLSDFLNNTDNALGGTGIINYPNHLDDLYKNDRGTRSTTNMVATALAAMYGGAALGAGSEGGLGATESAAGGAADTSLWGGADAGLDASGGFADGAFGGGEGGGALESGNAPIGGFNWQKMGQQLMRGQGGKSSMTQPRMVHHNDPYGLEQSGLPQNSYNLLPDSTDEKRKKITELLLNNKTGY